MSIGIKSQASIASLFKRPCCDKVFVPIITNYVHFICLGCCGNFWPQSESVESHIYSNKEIQKNDYTFVEFLVNMFKIKLFLSYFLGPK